MKYKVLKPFFKLSEGKNYSVGETIEMPKNDAQAMYLDGYLEEVKEVKTKKTDD